MCKITIKGMIMLICMAFAVPVRAQTFSEWFSQKKTQKKYLAEQIAALEVYKEFLKEGYSIVSGGLGVINNIRHGEFSLHNDFFSRLLGISPQIQHYSEVADIVAMQWTILKIKDGCMKDVAASAYFTAEEQAYIARVFNRLLDDCTATMDELITLITPSKLELSDDERLNRIGRLYLDMQEAKSFAEGFSGETALLGRSRYKDAQDVKGLSGMYGLDTVQ